MARNFSTLIPQGWSVAEQVTIEAGYELTFYAKTPGRPELYTTPVGSMLYVISKGAPPTQLTRSIVVEPGGRTVRDWELYGEPLEVRERGGGGGRIDPINIDVKRPTLKDAVGYWWILPAAWAAWYLAKGGGAKRGRNRRRRNPGAKFQETLTGALLVGAAGSLAANLVTGAKIGIAKT